jgi:hypothetical protein
MVKLCLQILGGVSAAVVKVHPVIGSAPNIWRRKQSNIWKFRKVATTLMPENIYSSLERKLDNSHMPPLSANRLTVSTS